MLALALRPITPEDDAFLLALYDSTREDLSFSGLEREARSRLVSMQFLAQRQAYRAAFPNATHSALLVCGATAGAVLVNRDAAELRVVDIALLPAHRGAGIGRRVLETIREEACANGRAVTLRVARDSPAVRLYARLGFSVTAHEPPYLAMRWAPLQPASAREECYSSPRSSRTKSAPGGGAE